MEPYSVIEASSARVPVLVSVPHCGTFFPEEVRQEFNQDLMSTPDDTDWFVDRLYDFAPELGMTMIVAVNSRWVIDLNRDPESKPLYTDGRIITELCPTTTFLGAPLYVDQRKSVSQQEVQRRVKAYYEPYHSKIKEILQGMKDEFGTALLWDCHSIRSVVPTIRKEKFPDLILGTNDERSASRNHIEQALSDLRSSTYQVNHNDPFKGGFITRRFGQPETGVHALQLEMCKNHYMDDSELRYDNARATKMRDVLIRTLKNQSKLLLQ